VELGASPLASTFPPLPQPPTLQDSWVTTAARVHTSTHAIVLGGHLSVALSAKLSWQERILR
jgi:hypothetical protein